jgi:hypothetical protein
LLVYHGSWHDKNDPFTVAVISKSIIFSVKIIFIFSKLMKFFPTDWCSMVVLVLKWRILMNYPEVVAAAAVDRDKSNAIHACD